MELAILDALKEAGYAGEFSTYFRVRKGSIYIYGSVMRRINWQTRTLDITLYVNGRKARVPVMDKDEWLLWLTRLEVKHG